VPRGSPPTGTAAVFVVGSVNADVILPVARLPAPGETVLAGDPVHLGGGKGANVAVAAARDGAAVRLVAAVGDDDAGAARLRRARARGGRRGRRRDGDRPAHRMAMVCVDRASENLIVVALGANAALDAAHVAGGLDALGRDDVCVVSFEVPAQAVAPGGRGRRRARGPASSSTRRPSGRWTALAGAGRRSS
jgi:ribokinase